MRVTAQQFVNGLSVYVQSNVIRSIPDASTKILVGTAVNALRANPSLVDSFVSGSALIRTVLCGEDGTYDISAFAQALRSSISEYGSLPITIPAIPLFTKTDKTLSFNSADIDALVECIERSSV